MTFKRMIPLLALLLIEAIVYVSVAEKTVFPIAADGEFAAIARETANLPPEPDLQAHAYLVRIIGEEQPLLRRREEKPLPPASITKLFTALIAKEVISEDTIIAFSEASKTTEEKMTSLPAGTEVTRDEALRLTLIMSANDAARALAEEIGKKWGGDTFAERLFIFTAVANEKARMLGLGRTRIENSTGLDDDEHLASAEDLARLAEYIWRVHPDLWEITRSLEIKIRTGDNKTYTAVNTNKLLGEFPAVLGGKTGFTDNAKETLVFLYPLHSGKVAAAVILGSEDRFGDGRKIIQWIESIR